MSKPPEGTPFLSKKRCSLAAWGTFTKLPAATSEGDALIPVGSEPANLTAFCLFNDGMNE